MTGERNRFLVVVAVLFALLQFSGSLVFFAKATGTTETDEWGEPEVEKVPTARDEDARRRLVELETWRRRLDAEKATKEQEEAEKVRFEFSGKFKIRLNTRENLHLNNSNQYWEYDEGTFIDERFQLKIDAIRGPLTMVALFDSGNFPYGWSWKEDSEGTLGRWSEFHTSQPPLVRELYLQYTEAFVVKAGKYGFFVGNGGIVLEGPLDSLKLMYPFGRTPLGRITPSIAYISVGGAFSDYSDFRSSGGPPAGARNALIGVPNKLDGLLLSAEISPGRYLTVEPYVLKIFDRSDTSADGDLNLDKDFDSTTHPRDGNWEPMWIGVAASGEGNGISYTADLIYLTGSYSKDRDIKAYAAMLRADYHFESNLSVGLEFGQGSGNKIDDTQEDDFTEFNGLFLCKERRKFGNIFSEDLRAGFFFWSSNLSNLTFARTIIDLGSTGKSKATLSAVKLWTTEEVYKGHGPVNDWSMGTSTSTEKTNDVGWEIDLDLLFPIYNQYLYGFVEIGYFSPGEAYQLPDGKDADAAWEIVMGTEYLF